MRDPQLLTHTVAINGSEIDRRFGWIGDAHSGTLLCQWTGCEGHVYCSNTGLANEVANEHWQRHLDHLAVAMFDGKAPRISFSETTAEAIFDTSHFGCARSEIEEVGGELPYRLRWLTAATDTEYQTGNVHEAVSPSGVRYGHFVLGAAVPIVGDEGHRDDVDGRSIQVTSDGLFSAGSWGNIRNRRAISDQLGHGVDFKPGQWAHPIAVVHDRRNSQ